MCHRETTSIYLHKPYVADALTCYTENTTKSQKISKYVGQSVCMFKNIHDPWVNFHRFIVALDPIL